MTPGRYLLIHWCCKHPVALLYADKTCPELSTTGLHCQQFVPESWIHGLNFDEVDNKVRGQSSAAADARLYLIPGIRGCEAVSAEMLT